MRGRCWRSDFSSSLLFFRFFVALRLFVFFMMAQVVWTLDLSGQRFPTMWQLRWITGSFSFPTTSFCVAVS